MSDLPPGKQSKKSRLLRPFKGLLSRRSRSPSHQGAQSVTTHNETASLSASLTNSAPQANSPSPQGAQSVIPDNTSASISALPMNSATFAHQVSSQGTEYVEILELSTMPSGSLTWDHRMKDWGSTAYEGLKTAIQGIYDCSGMFPPLQTTAGVLLTISKVVDVRGSMCSICKYVIHVSFCSTESFGE